MCRTSLILYLLYKIMVKCLIVYLPCMSLKDIWLIVHLPYMRDMSLYDMVVCILIVYDYEDIFDVYFPCMSLEDMVGFAHIIYERYEFAGHDCCILIVYDYGEIFFLTV